MDSFNENLSNFLVSCREAAGAKLRADKQLYGEKKVARDDLLAQLKAAISPEAKTLLESLMDAETVLQEVEYNAAFLCGLTTPARIQKCFEPGSPECKAFKEHYLQ